MDKQPGAKNTPRNSAGEAVAEKQREIQREQDRKEPGESSGGDSGIGRAVAVLYAREGADVAIVYLASHEDAQETRRCVEKEGRQCLLIAGDVKDSKFCKEAAEKTVAEFDRLDNAAFQEHAHSLEDITDERMEETFSTNIIMGYMRMARAALPHLKQGSCIVR